MIDAKQIFVLVPVAGMAQNIINRSTSAASDQMPKVTISEVEYFVVESDKDRVFNTRIFDAYRWISAKEAKGLLARTI